SEGHTLFRKRVMAPGLDDRIFKSGEHSRKIGSHCLKGPWKGFPIYTLTLEERATCPIQCEHWHDCYGNKMNWSTRWSAGDSLERAIPIHIGTLAKRFPAGFIIRLHVLGDFYSVSYVKMWHNLMLKHQNLHVFGYTRRRGNDVLGVGTRLEFLENILSHRWKIRWSERGGRMGTVTSKDVTLRGKTKDGIVCPAQTDDADCCGSC